MIGTTNNAIFHSILYKVWPIFLLTGPSVLLCLHGVMTPALYNEHPTAPISFSHRFETAMYGVQGDWRGAWENVLKDFLRSIKNIPQNGQNDFVMELISLYINRIFCLVVQQPKKAGKMWLRGKKPKN